MIVYVLFTGEELVVYGYDGYRLELYFPSRRLTIRLWFDSDNVLFSVDIQLFIARVIEEVDVDESDVDSLLNTLEELIQQSILLAEEEVTE